MYIEYRTIFKQKTVMAISDTILKMMEFYSQVNLPIKLFKIKLTEFATIH